ncbi:hypothetical protein GALMADRAFT_152929 [Galerina marginata CBS 339.88]|uniref:Uncharacterized protein n=1 Tax=Galerina marginata (strain CBS 339.88) TaxID=685588 RepID=A0A067TII7_GALM3|nr:hypothetical protein GALMADRAFT_152929 [Galerina marginata CBS 339.88]
MTNISVTVNGQDPDPVPQLGSQLINVTFIYAGTLGAIIWDILSNINADYSLAKYLPKSLPVAVITTLATFTFGAIVITQPMKNCSVTVYGLSWMFTLLLSSTTLLFFFRVRAVYMDKKYVIAFFFLSWLGVVAGCIAETQSGGPAWSSIPYPSNPYCLGDPINLLTLVTTMSTAPMANDVLSFCAITWRLMQISHVETTFKSSIQVMLFGHYLPAFSRALLRDGQVYFLCTVSLAILSTATFFVPGVPRIVSIAIVYPNVAIMNLMGCKIFRDTKLGLSTLSDPTQSIAFHVPELSDQRA